MQPQCPDKDGTELKSGYTTTHEDVRAHEASGHLCLCQLKQNAPLSDHQEGERQHDMQSSSCFSFLFPCTVSAFLLCHISSRKVICGTLAPEIPPSEFTQITVRYKSRMYREPLYPAKCFCRETLQPEELGSSVYCIILQQRRLY